MRRFLPLLALLAASCDAIAPPAEAERLSRQYASIEKTIEATDAGLVEDLGRLVALQADLDRAREHGDRRRIETLEPVVTRWQALVDQGAERLAADRTRLLELEVAIREAEVSPE